MNPRLSLLPLACLATATCSGAPPESPLIGLWSRSEAACDMGFGVRFVRDAVLFTTPDKTEPLLDRVTYQTEAPPDGAVRLIVQFHLGSDNAGTLVFERSPDGGLDLTRQSFQDARTGSVRMSLQPATGSLGAFARLEPCDGGALGEAMGPTHANEHAAGLLHRTAERTHARPGPMQSNHGIARFPGGEPATASPESALRGRVDAL